MCTQITQNKRQRARGVVYCNTQAASSKVGLHGGENRAQLLGDSLDGAALPAIALLGQTHFVLQEPPERSDGVGVGGHALGALSQALLFRREGRHPAPLCSGSGAGSVSSCS